MVRDIFNKVTAAAPALVLAASVTGCAMTPSQTFSPEGAADYAARTGINPVPYDACGELHRMTRGRTGSLGGAAGAIAGSSLGDDRRERAVGGVLGAVGGVLLEKHLRQPEVDKVYNDCLAQQAANNALGGSVSGTDTRFAPGGIFQGSRGGARRDYGYRDPYANDRHERRSYVGSRQQEYDSRTGRYDDQAANYGSGGREPQILKAWRECNQGGCFDYWAVPVGDSRRFQRQWQSSGVQLLGCDNRAAVCTFGAPSQQR